MTTLYSTTTTYAGTGCSGAALSIVITLYAGRCVRYSEPDSLTQVLPYQTALAELSPDGKSYIVTTKKYNNAACSGVPGNSADPQKVSIPFSCATTTDNLGVSTSTLATFDTTYPTLATSQLNFDGYKMSFFLSEPCSTETAMLAAPLNTCLWGGANIAKYSVVSACRGNTITMQLFSDPKCQTGWRSNNPSDADLPVCAVQKNLTSDANINFPNGMYTGYRAYATVTCLKSAVLVKPVDLFAVIVGSVSAFVAIVGIFVYFFFRGKKHKITEEERLAQDDRILATPTHHHIQGINTPYGHDVPDLYAIRAPEQAAPSTAAATRLTGSPSKSVHPEPIAEQGDHKGHHHHHHHRGHHHHHHGHHHHHKDVAAPALKAAPKTDQGLGSLTSAPKA